MNIPYAYSDPGAPRLHPIWKQPLPPLPDKVYAQRIPSFHGSTIGRLNVPRYHGRTSRMPQMPSAGVGSDVAYLETRSVGVNVPSVALTGEPELERRRRNCLLRILMAPCDFMEWLIRKWWQPNEDCMRCVKITYWIVLIVGGIISAVVPFLKY